MLSAILASLTSISEGLLDFELGHADLVILDVIPEVSEHY